MRAMRVKVVDAWLVPADDTYNEMLRNEMRPANPVRCLCCRAVVGHHLHQKLRNMSSSLATSQTTGGRSNHFERHYAATPNWLHWYEQQRGKRQKVDSVNAMPRYKICLGESFVE
jgi:hypothetical protein